MKGYMVFTFVDNKENIIYITSKGEEKHLQLKLWENSIEDTLGSCFCSILNSKNKVIDAKNLFNKSFSRININEQKLISGVANIMDLAFNLLLDVSDYFVILYDDLFEATINLISSDGIKSSEINDFCKQLKIRINNVFDSIIETISIFDNYYSKNLVIDTIFLPPATIVAVNGKVANKLQQYIYKIYNFDELLAVSFYLLNINNYHVRKCKLLECNKYFSASDGRIRYCNNPSPYNNGRPCINTVRTRNMEGYHLKYWEKELDLIYEDMRNSGQFFRDHIKSTKDKRKKEMIERNYKIFLETVKKYTRYIKACTDENKRKEYLSDYKDFINEIRQRQHHKPSIFKVPAQKIK